MGFGLSFSENERGDCYTHMGRTDNLSDFKCFIHYLELYRITPREQEDLTRIKSLFMSDMATTYPCLVKGMCINGVIIPEKSRDWIEYARENDLKVICTLPEIMTEIENLTELLYLPVGYFKGCIQEMIKNNSWVCTLEEYEAFLPCDGESVDGGVVLNSSEFGEYERWFLAALDWYCRAALKNNIAVEIG